MAPAGSSSKGRIDSTGRLFYKGGIQQFDAGGITRWPTKGTLMDRFRRSWELLKSSLAVMMENKLLLAFPILISTLTIFMAMLFLTPVAFQRTGYSYGSAEHWKAVGNSIVHLNAVSNDNRP